MEATETVGAEAAIAEAEKERVEVQGVAEDAAYYSLENYLYEGGKLNKDRERLLRDTLRANNIALPLYDVLQNPAHSAIRAQLLAVVNRSR